MTTLTWDGLTAGQRAALLELYETRDDTWNARRVLSSLRAGVELRGEKLSAGATKPLAAAGLIKVARPPVGAALYSITSLGVVLVESAIGELAILEQAAYPRRVVVGAAIPSEPTYLGLTVADACDRIERGERTLLIGGRYRQGKAAFVAAVKVEMKRRRDCDLFRSPEPLVCGPTGYTVGEFARAMDPAALRSYREQLLELIAADRRLADSLPDSYLAPAIGVERVGAVMRAGAPEHGDRWKTRSVAHHLGAALRHVGRHIAGQTYDHDLHAAGHGKHSHLACAGARVLMALHLVDAPESR